MNIVLAVSGGVDSVVLLDAVVSHRLAELGTHLPSCTTIVVTHFDHGIRSDSHEDSRLVRELAKKYGLLFESTREELGSEASETYARERRYLFLRQVCKKYNATLVTAHHQDDLIETILINLLRGTSWRGLAAMSEVSDETFKDPSNTVLRPLLGTTKQRLLEYAQKYNLKWREDSTNADQAYLRNYVRLTMLPTMRRKDPSVEQKLLHIHNNLKVLKKDIATELQKVIPEFSYQSTEYALPRHPLIMYPPSVALEVLYNILTTLDPNWHPTSMHLKRVLHFIKTAQIHKRMEVSGGVSIQIQRGSVQFKRA